MQITYTPICDAQKEELYARQAGHHLAEYISGVGEKPLLLLLSGGSAFKLLEYVELGRAPLQLTLGVLDERCDVRSVVNNYAQMSEMPFVRKWQRDHDIARVELINTRVEPGETCEALAGRFERYLRGWKSTHPDGQVLITQGIGADGHTAGILPYPEDQAFFDTLFQGTAWVAGYDAGEKNEYPLRATTTLTFLREVVDYTVLFVVGDSKQQALETTFASPDNIQTCPARIIHHMKAGRLFTDCRLPISPDFGVVT